MSSTRIADVVAAVPFAGGQRYVKVGALLKMDNNDESKGPGFVIMLDKYFNPAGIPGRAGVDPSSVALSTYWPKEPSRAPTAAPPHRAPGDPDDDIPF